MKCLLAFSLLGTGSALASEGVDLILPTQAKTIRLRVELVGPPVERWGQFLDDLFDYADRDGDGKLSPDERKKLIPLPEIAKLDGELTKANFKAACRKAGFVPLTAKVVPPSSIQVRAGEILFERLDSNRDGSLSKEELGRFGDLFKRLDADENDILTREEILAAGGSRELTAPKTEPVRSVSLDPKTESTLSVRITVRPDSKSPWKVEVHPESAAKFEGDTFRLFRDGLSLSFAPNRDDFDTRIKETHDFHAEAFRSAVGKRPFLNAASIEDDPALAAVAVTLPFADRDGDGKLTSKEMDAFLTLIDSGFRCRWTLVVSDPGLDLFALLDDDGDGRIDRREAARAAKILLGDRPSVSRGDLTRRVAIALEEHAVGPIRLAPAKRIASAVAKKVPVGPAWFRAMDRNGDGVLTPQEFLGPPEKFALWDSDGDGLLSAAEAEAADKGSKKE